MVKGALASGHDPSAICHNYCHYHYYCYCHHHRHCYCHDFYCCDEQVPEEASLSVVKGAVAFGHDPSAICQRICRFTYGVGSYLPFVEGEHREDLRVNSDGMDLCKVSLRVLLFFDWLVCCCHTFTRTYQEPVLYAKSIPRQIYSGVKLAWADCTPE